MKRLSQTTAGALRAVQDFGTDSALEPLQLAKIRFLNNALLIGILAMCLNMTLDVLSGRSYVVPQGAQMLASLIVGLLLQKRRLYGLAKLTLLGFFTLQFMAGHLTISFIGTENYLFVILMIGFTILEHAVSLVLLTLYCVTLYLGVMYGMETDWLHQGDLPGHYRYVNSALALTIVALLANRYARLNARQVQVLDSLNKDLHNKHLLTQQLMRELNHRVKNNLQLISSLFNLQARSTASRETSEALTDARNRINAIAILHQKLYQEALTFEVDVAEYVKSLCGDLRQSMPAGNLLDLQWTCPSCVLRIEESIYVGLVLNELITNSIKHGHQEPAPLSIKVAVRIEHEGPVTERIRRLTLDVADNGPGFAQRSPKVAPRTFGLSLIETIVEQYDGALCIDRELKRGARVSATLLLRNP
jgi:two-component sensor histidine kinase